MKLEHIPETNKVYISFWEHRPLFIEGNDSLFVLITEVMDWAKEHTPSAIVTYDYGIDSLMDPVASVIFSSRDEALRFMYRWQEVM